MVGYLLKSKYKQKREELLKIRNKDFDLSLFEAFLSNLFYIHTYFVAMSRMV